MFYFGVPKKKNKLFTLVGIFVFLFVFQNTPILFAVAPTVTTGSASTITKTTAELNGSITDNGGELITEAGFEYGLTTSYGSSITGTTGYAYDSQFGTPGSGNGQLSTPYYVALDSSDNIYVVDAGNSRIQKFNSAGVYQSQFGTPGSGNGEFDGLISITVDSSDNIYTGEQSNSRIQKFNSAGVYQSQFGTPGSGNGEFGPGLSGITSDSLGNIYVVDRDNSRIQKFNSAGVYQSQFGTPGSGDAEFIDPLSIALDSSDNIYVVDAGNSRIQKFNSAGVYQSQWSIVATDIVIDSEDNFFVTSDNNFKKYDSSGSLLGTFGSAGSGDGEFNSPIGIGVNSVGDVYISDFSNDRIQKFKQSVINPTEITGLTCGTVYHFRAYAVNTDGTSNGSDNTLTTSDCEPPEVDTKAATNITTTSATINGFDLIINDISIADVDRSFEYGFTASYGQTINASAALVSQFGSVGSGNGEFNGPYGQAFDSVDNIYVADLSNSRIQKFNSSGVYQSQFGSVGSGDGQFDNPWAIAIDSSDNTYVVDRDNNRIQKFNSSGVYQSQFGTLGTGNGQFDQPYDIDLDSSDNTYVVDRDNNRIQKFNSSGVYQSQFGSAGSGDGQFNNPLGLAIDSGGNIYIADIGNGRVQKFNSSGVYQSQFSALVHDGDGFVDDVLVDIDGSLYMFHVNTGYVTKVTNSGVYISLFDADAPKKMAMDSQNNIYLSDNNVVKKFNRSFSANISSLKCGETYHYRALATNAEGTDYGDDMTFTTDACSGGGGGPIPIYGCTNSIAVNYNPNATADDGSCLIVDPPPGCNDPDAINYNPIAGGPNTLCIYDPGAIPGCTDQTASNYDSSVTVDDGSCQYGGGGGPTDGPTTVLGCMNSGALNFNSTANSDDGSCNFTLPLVYGCTDVSATNFAFSANTDDGSCLYIGIIDIFGEVIGGATEIIKQVPEKIILPIAVGGIVASSLLMNFLQPGLIAGIIIRLWNLIPVLIGYRRKKRPWGTVYDSVTKQPLDPVYVILKTMSGAEQSTSITDLDGRYGFLAEAGTYTISANKTNYVFPSTKLSGKTEDDLYNNLYFGGPINLTEKEEIIYKNIPMDAINFNWNEFTKSENKKLMKFYSKRDLFFARTANILFIAGLLSSIILFFVTTSTLNSIILSIYALILILRFFGIKPKQGGYAFDTDGIPLSFGVIRLFSADLNKEIAHTVIGKTGKYYMLTTNGEYYLKISRKTGEDSYQEVLTTDRFTVKGGYVHKKIVV